MCLIHFVLTDLSGPDTAQEKLCCIRGLLDAYGALLQSSTHEHLRTMLLGRKCSTERNTHEVDCKCNYTRLSASFKNGKYTLVVPGVLHYDAPLFLQVTET